MSTNVLTVEEAKDEVQVRRTLQCQMVGSLYPSTLHDEIVELNQYITK